MEVAVAAGVEASSRSSSSSLATAATVNAVVIEGLKP
jgi:hypothetical protein